MIKKMLRGIPGLFKRNAATSINWPKVNSDNKEGGKLVVPHKTVPAPKVLSYDPWFGPPPKTESLIKYERELSELEKLKPKPKEPENIHQLMYEMATKNNVLFQGGSENIEL